MRKVTLFLLALSACTRGSESARQLEVFAAASLGATLNALEPRFEAEHPGVDVRLELSNSALACQKVADQGRDADLVLSADSDLIDTLLVPAHADFNLLFAGGSLVVAYPPESRVAAELDHGTPWQEVLARKDVRVGIANPAVAPVGYRALLALQLNDKFAPQALRLGARITAALDPAHQRPDVTKLVAPLVAGEIDVAFIYRSEAATHKLHYQTLDPRIDFSSPAHQSEYETVQITLPAVGGQPARTVRGSAALYSLTIPRRAPQPELAMALVRSLLSNEGAQLAEQNFLPLLPIVDRRVHGSLPPALTDLVAQVAVSP